ncbi:septum formation initiator family protein [Treponema sp. C6A8]|uniref:septum formation initiator family protein n=1 Tax=Treponema sp. C6A8 TaxID=1410609 RepID=UPI000570BEA9|nr:cell division protein FtsL [Treponema sp. C6A8]
MRVEIGDFFKKVLLCALALSIPVMLYLYAVQAKRYTDLEKDLRDLERKQAELIEQNKKLVSDISVLSSADRIEKIAVEDLGMHKAQAEDIVRVEMTGERKK